MKKCLLFALLLSMLELSAQKYGNVWQFGDGAGIDFNGCTEVALTNGVNPGFEGCSSVCDETTGQLLFYTNSSYVWNSQNTLMQNGNLMNSSGTLSQVLIIKKPLSANIYYIFTTRIQGTGTLNFSYHTIDMSLNGGLGSVISVNNSLTAVNITEQVAATYHSNGTDIWVMTHEYGTNNFLAYLVTSAGVSTTAIVSSVGPFHITGNSNFNARGEIKFSPNGLKLAFNGNGNGINNATNILCLFDFNNSTGAVLNPLNLPFSRGEFGLSFSSDNSKLYGTTWKAFNFTLTDYNYLYQFDLSSANPLTIINSKIIIDSIPVGNNGAYGSIKLAPNGKIYVAKWNAASLGVINSPNSSGLACNYVSNGFYLQGKTCQYGLNNYIEYTNYQASSPLSVSVVSTSSLLCAGNTAILNASGANSYTWNPGVLNTPSIVITPTTTITFSVVGTDSISGCIGTATITQNVVPLPIITITSSSPLICSGDTVTLSGNGDVNNFSWSPGGFNGSAITVVLSGTSVYTVTGTNTLSSCSNSASFTQSVSLCTILNENFLQDKSALRVFPNPGGNNIAISTEEDLEIKITDETGKLVQVIHLSEKNNHVTSLSYLENGIYFITGITRENRLIKEKFIIVK